MAGAMSSPQYWCDPHRAIRQREGDHLLRVPAPADVALDPIACEPTGRRCSALTVIASAQFFLGNGPRSD